MQVSVRVSLRDGKIQPFKGSALAVAGALLVLGAGSVALADPSGARTDFTVRVDQAATPAGGTSLSWDARKGRWGMTLNVESPQTREADWSDVKAGAYFRVSPSLSIGGAVSMGDQAGQPEAWRKIAPKQQAPRVRLETAFKF